LETTISITRYYQKYNGHITNRSRLLLKHLSI